MEYSKEYQKGELKIKIIVIIKRQQQICQSLNVPLNEFQESVATGMAHVIWQFSETIRPHIHH